MLSLRQPEIHETGVVMPALRRQRHEDTCELKGSLVYIVSVRPELHSKTLSQKQKARRQRSRRKSRTGKRLNHPQIGAWEDPGSSLPLDMQKGLCFQHRAYKDAVKT